MGWSGWNYVDTNMSIGKYRLWYRTHDNYSTDTVALQYEVEVEDTGTKTERWNCYVGVWVDGGLHSQSWSNYSNKDTTTGAGSTVPGHSGYYSGYTCISTKTITKGVSGTTKSRSWTLSLAGGFTQINRRDCTCSVEPSASYYYTNGSAPTLTITDNGDNTATMSGSLGSNGTNNGIAGSTLYWTTNGLQPNGGSSYTAAESMGTTSGGSYSKTINIPSTCSTIWAVTYCSFSYNSTNTGHINQSVKYYTAPGDPGKPVIEYTKSRLTIKEPWTISWDAAQAGNTNTPISGYRLRIYKNGLPIDIKNSSGTVVSATVGADKYYDMSGTSYVINPSSHGILPGDKISIALFAYAFNGAGTRLWSGNEENAVLSDVYTVQNAGVMRPLVDGKHVEGVVWACIPDSTTDSKIKWVEADIVKTAIKDSSTNSIKWVEGE